MKLRFEPAAIQKKEKIMCYTGSCPWESWDYRCGSKCHKPKGAPCPDPDPEPEEEEHEDDDAE